MKKFGFLFILIALFAMSGMAFGSTMTWTELKTAISNDTTGTVSLAGNITLTEADSKDAILITSSVVINGGGLTIDGGFVSMDAVSKDGARATGGAMGALFVVSGDGLVSIENLNFKNIGAVSPESDSNASRAYSAAVIANRYFGGTLKVKNCSFDITKNPNNSGPTIAIQIVGSDDVTIAGKSGRKTVLVENNIFSADAGQSMYALQTMSLVNSEVTVKNNKFTRIGTADVTAAGDYRARLNPIALVDLEGNDASGYKIIGNTFSGSFYQGLGVFPDKATSHMNIMLIDNDMSVKSIDSKLDSGYAVLVEGAGKATFTASVNNFTAATVVLSLDKANADGRVKVNAANTDVAALTAELTRNPLNGSSVSDDVVEIQPGKTAVSQDVAMKWVLDNATVKDFADSEISVDITPHVGAYTLSADFNATTGNVVLTFHAVTGKNGVDSADVSFDVTSMKVSKDWGEGVRKWVSVTPVSTEIKVQVKKYEPTPEPGPVTAAKFVTDAAKVEVVEGNTGNHTFVWVRQNSTAAVTGLTMTVSKDNATASADVKGYTVTVKGLKVGTTVFDVHVASTDLISSGDTKLTVTVSPKPVEVETKTVKDVEEVKNIIKDAPIAEMLTKNADGDVVIDTTKIGGTDTNKIVFTIPGGDKLELDRKTTVAVPVFTAAAKEEGGAVIAPSKVNLALIPTASRDFAMPVKVTADGDGLKLTPLAAGKTLEQGVQGEYTLEQIEGDNYLLKVVILDNMGKNIAPYDLNEAPIDVLDPMVIGVDAADAPNPPVGEGSGGGCSAGYVPFALILAAPLFFIRKRK